MILLGIFMIFEILYLSLLLMVKFICLDDLTDLRQNLTAIDVMAFQILVL